jgi:hypothetical protein
MVAFFGLISLPIGILNAVCGIVGCVWLAILGKWSAIGSYLIIYVVSIFAVRFLLLSELIFTRPAEYLAERNKAASLVMFLDAFATLWAYIMMAAWCVFSFYSVLNASSAEETLWPHLLSAYSLATVPWIYSTARENHSSGEAAAGLMFATLGLCISAIALAISILNDPLLPVRTAVITIIAPLVLFFIFQTVLGVLSTLEISRTKRPEQ